MRMLIFYTEIRQIGNIKLKTVRVLLLFAEIFSRLFLRVKYS